MLPVSPDCHGEAKIIARGQARWWYLRKRRVLHQVGIEGEGLYHDEIVKSGRKPRKRGLKPWRGRGGLLKRNSR
ncbi:hypothetical protein [Candidatus Nitrososphaera gargensis]|uniref:hypothetical protein n=1 Tax=Candidatus Nitrososphaera gargensis TaxID=497727 RepID=UPI0011E572D4|nr:hypothetical protein [Candidatus Nitrososphaera gargensis]